MCAWFFLFAWLVCACVRILMMMMCVYACMRVCKFVRACTHSCVCTRVRALDIPVWICADAVMRMSV